MWDVKTNGCSYTLLIMDEFTANEETDEALHRENIVICLYLSDANVEDEHVNTLSDFAKSLTDHIALAHCEVNITFQSRDVQQAVADVMNKRYGFTEAAPRKTPRSLFQYDKFIKTLSKN